MSLNKSKSLRTAEKYVLQGKIPSAIDEYRKVVDADPADLTTINTLGDLYVRAGRIPDAIQNFSRIADSYRDSGFTLKAIAMLKKISKLDPTNIETSMKLANLYSQQGLFVEARQQYLQVADAYARAGQTRKALEAYQKIADLDPSNTAVRIKLGEIYSREGMVEQAHEAFILAGAEFLRRGDTEQALAANLKALAIRPEGRQALTAIVSIYTQQGQADRAINILCDAFEKNPGDVELLTILGRTYLAADCMDDAERTFLSLVELDKNRYNYLLELGRKFVQMGDLDRATEQIDGCMEVLISKREEDKGIDFLRRILDRDPNHIPALKRLAQIFVRIREDHNLIATLNSLAEAAMHNSDNDTAVEALEELVRLEPDEQRHRQRLYNLGVTDIVEPGAPDVVRATGPLDYQSAAFDDAFVIRQISEAEILVGHGQTEHAISMLREILSHAPDNVQVHIKLKDIYLRAGMLDKAATQCQALANVYEGRGESGKAMDCMLEAQDLDPMLAGGSPAAGWSDSAHSAGDGFDIPLPAAAPVHHDPFDIKHSGRLDLSRYETGPLSDQMGFVTAPPKGNSKPVGMPAEPAQPRNGSGAQGRSFTYSDTLIDGPTPFSQEQSLPGEEFFGVPENVVSDTMPSQLRDELDGIDFYIAQGYMDIAHDTLNRLRDEYGDHHEIMVRYERLGIAAAPTRAIEEDALSKIGFVEPPPPVVQTETARPPVEQLEFDLPIPDGQSTFEDPFAQASAGLLQMDTVEPEISQPDILSSGTLQADIPRLDSQQLDSQQPDSLEFDKLVPMIAPEPLTSKATGELVPAQSNGHSAQTVPDRGERIQISTRKSTRDLKQEQESAPFIVHKESGPLKSEHVVKFNTSDLPAVDPGITDEDLLATVEPPQPEPPIAMAPPERKPVAGTAELVASLLSGIDDSLEDLFNVASRSVVPEPEVELEEALRQREFEEASAAPEPEVTALHAEDDFAIVSEPPVETASEVPPEQPAAAEPFGSWQPSVQAEPSPAPFGAASGPETLLALGLEEERSGADLDGDLRQMFEDLSGNTGSLDPLSDFETHYSLGLAYKDMDLLDEAIEQFQLAFKQSSKTATDADSVQCCHLLGVCFKRKQMPKLAVMWFSRGIKIPNRSEDEYQALRFEVGQCYEEMGDVEKAIDMFSEVYGIDVNYRHVSEKLRQLQAAKNT